VTAQPSPDRPATCRAQYPRPANVSRNTRLIHCGLPAGHSGEHEEDDTEVTWAQDRPELIGCPTCRTTLRNPACPDLWHFDNRTADLYRTLGRRVEPLLDALVLGPGQVPPAPAADDILATIRTVTDQLRQADETYQAALHALAAGGATTEQIATYAIRHALQRTIPGIGLRPDELATTVAEALRTTGHIAVPTTAADLAAMTARAESAEAMYDQARAQLAQMIAGRATWKAKALEMERARDLAEVDRDTLAAIRAHDGTGPETGPSATHSPEQATAEGQDPDGPQDGSGGAA
jgi:hypothetical protein